MFFKKDKRSFFEKLTGVVSDEEERADPTLFQPEPKRPSPSGRTLSMQKEEDSTPQEESEGELPVDVYQTPSEIIVQAFVAGVRPDDLQVSITHEAVTIKGRRDAPHGVSTDDYMTNELYWGSFSRTIVLPQEVEPEEAEALEKHGLLAIRLPKIDKAKLHRVKVKTV